MDSTPSSPEKVDLYIKISSVRFPVSILVLIISTAAFIPLTFILFNPGPPINSDIGVHYSSLACLKDNPLWWSLPTAWCSHGQAGLSRFSRYAIVHGYLTLLLWTFLPLELAFKFMMVFTFLLLPVAAYFFLRWMGYPLGGAIAYTIFLLEPGGYYWGGFYLHFVQGAFINNFGTGMSLATIFALVWMLSKPTRFRVVTASAIHAVYFLTHQSSSLWLPTALAPMAILYRHEIKQHWKTIIIYPIWLFLFVSFWLIPALSKSSYFTLPGLGGIGKMGLSYFFTRFPTPQFIIILFSFAGAIYLLFRNQRETRLNASIIVMIPIVWIVSHFAQSSWYFQYFTLDRSIYEFRTFTLLCGSLLLGGCQPALLSRWRKPLLIAGMIFLLGLITSFYPTDLTYSSSIFTGQDIEPIVLPVYTFVQSAQGRIVAENTFHTIDTPAGFYSQPWSLSAGYSDREFLGNSDFWYTKDDYSVFYKNHFLLKDISQFPPQQFMALLWGLNVQYIWAYTNVTSYLSTILPVAQNFTPSASAPTGIMYQTPWPHSYLHYFDGELINASYHNYYADAISSSSSGGILSFKVRQWPNWHATIDSVETPITRASLGLMEIHVPAGTHRIHFEYRMNPVDWMGYMVSIFGLLAAIVWVKLSMQ